MGQRKISKIKKRNLNPYFDEVFYFNFKDLKKQQIMEGKISLTVADCDISICIPSFKDFALSRTTIGSFSVDAMSVYKSKDHEMYKTWGILFNSEEPDETGEQGRIRFSIVVLGPGDSQKMHDSTKETMDDTELEDDTDLEDGNAAAAVIGDDVTQKLNFLVVSAVKAEGLPGFDSLFGKGLYCSAIVEFGSSVPAMTSRLPFWSFD